MILYIWWNSLYSRKDTLQKSDPFTGITHSPILSRAPAHGTEANPPKMRRSLSNRNFTALINTDPHFRPNATLQIVSCQRNFCKFALLSLKRLELTGQSYYAWNSVPIVDVFSLVVRLSEAKLSLNCHPTSLWTIYLMLWRRECECSCFPVISLWIFFYILNTGEPVRFLGIQTIPIAEH